MLNGIYFGDDYIKFNPTQKKYWNAIFDIDSSGNLKLADNEYKEFVSEAKKCNHTPKGKSCPVHGMKECSGMYESA